ncbi:MAG: DUF3105 domain-containing protein [Actinomycetota bacterium]
MTDRRTSTEGRTTKAERREQARRERFELRRKMARSKRNRRIGIVVSALLVAAVVAFVVTRPSTSVASPQELLAQATQAKQVAGCGPVEDVGPFQPRDRDRAHLADPTQAPPLSGYPSVPPASGPHDPIPLSYGVYETPPPIFRVIHSLEHGAAIVWYSPDASGAELEALKEFYRDPDVGSRVIVAPYDYPADVGAGRLPAGTQMALVAWHHVERCARVSLAAAFDFSSEYAAPPFGSRPYLGNAPEPGGAL